MERKSQDSGSLDYAEIGLAPEIFKQVLAIRPVKVGDSK
jgi:hypothetical protein